MDPNKPSQPDLNSTLGAPPPVQPPAPPQEPVTPMTPLDNPMQAPPQPPAIDSGFSWSNPQPAQPSTPPPITPQDLYGPSTPPPEAAPTDLSHLVAEGSEQPVYTPPITQPETLVTPPVENNDMPSVPIENHSGGMPKWSIGLGLGILLAVIGASGYFILGVGKSEQEPVSKPATTQRTTLTPPPSPVTAATPATGSSTFGALEGSSPATSAADLLKQRQGR